MFEPVIHHTPTLGKREQQAQSVAETKHLSSVPAGEKKGRTSTHTVGLVLSGGGMGGAGFHLAVLEQLLESGQLVWADVKEVVGVSIGACVATSLLGTDPGTPHSRLLARSVLQHDQTLLTGKGLFSSLDGRWRGGWRGMLLPGVGDARTIVNALDSALGEDIVWPEHVELKIVAWDVRSWERTVFDRDSSIKPTVAAGASSALPPFFAPICIEGRGYIDGAIGSNTHADIVGDVEEVIILDALGTHSHTLNLAARYVQRKHRAALERELETLVARNIEVSVYEPPDGLENRIWRNPLSREAGWAIYDQMSPKRHAVKNVNDAQGALETYHE